MHLLLLPPPLLLLLLLLLLPAETMSSKLQGGTIQTSSHNEISPAVIFVEKSVPRVWGRNTRGQDVLCETPCDTRS